MKKLLETINGRKFKSPPIWMMRQAGRYLPEYMAIRSKEDSFLKLCYNPKLASEITLQPIKRFGFDGAIIFSDILVIPDALGIKVDFIKGEGPKLDKILNNNDLSKLRISNILNHLDPVFENISITKSKLDKNTTLIGFSGSPWTIATYMIEGGSSKKFDLIRHLSIENEEFFQNLINILIESISLYLCEQIKYGVDVVKLFDSWSGILPESEFKKWVIEPHKKIINNIKKQYPSIPIIVFTKGAGTLYENFVKEVSVDVIAIDQNISKSYANSILQKKYNKVIQGNLDNIILATDKNRAIKETKDIINKFNNFPFIFNLGHGVLPHTPIENIEAIIKEIRDI